MFELPEAMQGKRILLHFGGVDYKTWVYVNGKLAGTHTGENAAFSFEITQLLKEGPNELVVRVFDDLRSGLQVGGKQALQQERRLRLHPDHGHLAAGLAGSGRLVVRGEHLGRARSRPRPRADRGRGQRHGPGPEIDGGGLCRRPAGRLGHVRRRLAQPAAGAQSEREEALGAGLAVPVRPEVHAHPRQRDDRRTEKLLRSAEGDDRRPADPDQRQADLPAADPGSGLLSGRHVDRPLATRP